MKKTLVFLFLMTVFSPKLLAQTNDTLVAYYDKIEKSFKYESGKITLSEGEGILNVPKGFKFLNAAQTQDVLSNLWGNPEDKSVLGSLVPDGKGVTHSNSWMFVISYRGDGFVKDDDAGDIDYDDLLKTMKEDVQAENAERKKGGYPEVQLVGWASKPYYDNNLKVLHWAKELKFGTDEANTLNYDLRVLGRKGMYNISAVAGMDELAEVKASIPGVLKSVEFNEGHKYLDFDADTDTVAAWTIGGLVAGKVLAKVGFFAIIAKFGKIIFLAIAAGFAAIRKFFFGKKNQVTTKIQEETASLEENNYKEE
ncbi:DUF2167 domain-containing protein [Flavobacterium aquidurense]|jgi:uncharacterized membrane-anchored protein|uniref:DUF2167 domain-containing protein n=1 Tax=Flavobacterium aquidurense TaxID=362413 RepID=UPI000922654C|nr:DUF2167 domain-containing protein [Flavobacterium aquidurense]OXA70592.1 hypothetical protein B0A67_15315 [Flavobacterium aquidurense]SHG30916.1 Uncharacterized membrane-anchored protein [Flavobacterium frigidimaris]